ncbi:MAG: hypothetical protein AB2535_02740 [Candidatus Thiodiazotropha endolucinida]
MNHIILRFAALSVFLYPPIIHAYIGPGTGLGAIGTVIAFLAALLLLIVGFVWYPIKRFFRRHKSKITSNKTNKD